MQPPKFPQRWNGEYPPDVAQLIRKHNGVIGNAERASRTPLGHFSKIRRGKCTYTEFVHRNVIEALSQPDDGENQMANPKAEIPDTCPPLLAKLIKHRGSKMQTRGFLGVGESTLNKMMTGSVELTAAQIIKIKAELGESVINAPRDDAPQSSAPAGPAFVPWDGKDFTTVELQPKAGAKKGRKVKVPTPLGLLIQKYPNLSQVAQSMGHTSGALTGMLTDPKRFNDKWQRKVHASLHGLAPAAGTSMGEEFDKYSLGIAICMVKGANFDRIADIADILMAKMVFRKNTKDGWIIIYRMADEDLPKFKRLALRDASEIVCP